MLPGGRTFLLSSQLRLVQDRLLRPVRVHGFQLVGSSLGQRPVLVLKDNSTIPNVLVGDNGLQMPVFVYFALIKDGKLDPASHYSSRLRNVDIVMGSNPGVVAVSMTGAQLCSIEDVSISGTDFHSGVAGLPGSGGFTVGLNVSSGQYGIYQQQFRPTPSVSSVVLKDQTVASVFVSVARGPLIVSGFRIAPAKGAACAMMNATGSDGGLLLEDGILEASDSKAAIQNIKGADLVLRNVFAHSPVVANSGANDELRILKGSTDWVHAEYAYTRSSSVLGSMSDLRVGSASKVYPESDVSAPASAAPSESNMLSKHGWRDVATADTPHQVDIVADYGATPEWVNAKDDDAKAIQRALDDAANPNSPHFDAVVYVPRGSFHIWLFTVGRGALLLTFGPLHCSYATSRRN
jgi:hypothetical protein